MISNQFLKAMKARLLVEGYGVAVGKGDEVTYRFSDDYTGFQKQCLFETARQYMSPATWILTDFTITGGRHDLESAYLIIRSLGDRQHKNEIELTGLARVLDCDTKKIFCGGYIDRQSLSLCEGGLTFSTLTPRQVPYQLIYELCRLHPSLRYYFYCDDCQITNDAGGAVYPNIEGVRTLTEEEQLTVLPKYDGSQDLILRTLDGTAFEEIKVKSIIRE